MWNNRKGSCFSWPVLLAVLQVTTPSSAGYSERPADVTVNQGEPVAFRCGVDAASPNVTLTFSGSRGTFDLTCPGDHKEAVPRTLFGQCDISGGESLATWSLIEASAFDTGTQVVCKQPKNPEIATAVLSVNPVSDNKAVLIGCTVGGFFVTLLVFGLLYLLLLKSEAFRQCFRGKDTEDDLSTIVTTD